MLRIGMLTSGGDCQALNAALRGVAKTLYAQYNGPVEIYGFLDGYRGMIYGNYKKLTPLDFKGILTQGGTMLGTSRTPFKFLDVPTEDGLNKVASMKQTYKELQLDGLVMGGGNGSTKTANRLSEEGLNVIALPKTIDNDTWGTDYTFGFDSAIEIATKCIDDIHTTASSHGRVFVIEIMGHKVGWIPLYAGVAGGADVILLPEIPYDINNVIKTIDKRNERGSRFTIIAAAEGAISVEEASLKRKHYKQRIAERTSPSVAYDIAAEIINRTNYEVRVAVPGHTQRGGTPCAYDRVFASQVGVEAAKGILAGESGFMVADKDRQIVRVPLDIVAGRLKTVPVDHQLVQQAKLMGISFGDEGVEGAVNPILKPRKKK